MAKSSRTKTRGVNLPVPQSRDEAAQTLRQIGEAQRDIARIEADMNDAISKLKEEAERKAAPFREQVTAWTEGLKIWAEAHRDSLTNGGKVKFADLGTGKILWRLRPTSLRITGAERVIEAIKKLGLQAFLRTKEEVNKEAMLAAPEKAKMIAGVSIGTMGEDFIAEPFEAALAPAAPNAGGNHA